MGPTLDAVAFAEEYGPTPRATHRRIRAADPDAAVHRHQRDRRAA